MKKQVFVLAGFLMGLILAGCSFDEGFLPSDEQSSDVNDQSSLKSAQMNVVPFKSTFTCGGEEIIPEEPDGFFHQLVYGSGNATHMGKTELLIADESIDMTDMENCIAEADVVFTAANGDELWFHYSSAFDLTTGFVEPYIIYVRDAIGTVYGGTGRFENATGTIVYEGDWNMTTGKGICTFTGEIQY